MSDHRRLESFENAYSADSSPKPDSIASPADALALVDEAIRLLGIDPGAATGPGGWRRLSFGTAHGRVNVVDWAENQHFLVIWSPILRAPQDARLRAKLFKALLELNHLSTGMARFSLSDETVVLAAVRPIEGLDVEEVLAAIRTVLLTADHLDEDLQHLYQVLMPGVDMDERTWRVALDLLRLCDERTQFIFVTLMERWVAKKGTIDAGRRSIGLAGGKSSEQAAAIVGHASAGPIVTVSWDSLERVRGLPRRSVAAFQRRVPRPDRFAVTESSAHLPVDESFTIEMVDQLIEALLKLDRVLARTPHPEPPPPIDLEAEWGLKIKMGGATQRNMDQMLRSCPDAVRKIYTKLIQGWYDAGQPVYTHKPDRVYLRLAVDGHKFALCTLWGPKEPRPARIELFYPLSYYFENHLEARRRYEQKIVQLPGFSVHNSGARIEASQAFTLVDAGWLLGMLRSLAEAVAE